MKAAFLCLNLLFVKATTSAPTSTSGCSPVAIPDGSFENGAIGWYSLDANVTDFTVQSGNAQDGSYFIRIANGGARQTFDFSQSPVQEFTLSGYSRHTGPVRVDNPNDYSILCDLHHTDGSATFGVTSDFDPQSAPDVWHYTQLDVTSTKLITDAWCYAMFRNGNGTVDFDNFKLIKCPVQPPTPPTSSCLDLDTQACVLFQTAKPDLCTDPAFAQSTCKRFCGQCPLECYSCPTPVRHITDCQTTTACPVNTTCMTKHLRALDGHDEYIMTCEKKEICDGLSLGFPFGKRETVVEERGRHERDVSLSCCDTDFCNLPQVTTTTMATTTPGLGQCARDIVFVVDDSGSVGHTNFRHSLDFIRQIISSLDIGVRDNQVSLLTYSTHPNIDWFLNTYSTKYDTMSAVDKVHFASGTTRTGDALEAVRTNVLIGSKGDRPNAENVVIVLTDGRSTDKSDTLHEANRLHAVSKDVISIVIGSGVDQAELNAIATDGHHVLDVRGYTDLSALLPQVLRLICN